MNAKSNFMAIAASSIGLTIFAASAFAQTAVAIPASAPSKAEWNKDHPRRAEVNARIAKQNKRITNEVKEGEINKSQAQALRATDKSVRAQERADAKANGGHITKAEQANLNQQLNQNSQVIGK